MRNYQWTANGKFIKNYVENFDQSFSINDASLCIDDHCLTKDDINFIKESKDSYDIDEHINSKNIITLVEVKKYIKNMFKTIYDINDEDDKKAKITNYFSLGWYDNRMGSYERLDNIYYDNINFLDAYISSDTFQVQSTSLPESMISDIMNSGNVILMGDTRKTFKLTDSEVEFVVPLFYFIMHEKYKLMILRVKYNSIFRWKVLLYTDDLIINMMNKFDLNFSNMYEDTLLEIQAISNELRITSSEFRNLVNAVKQISITQGNYDYNILKDNLFFKDYTTPLNLEKINDDFFENVLLRFVTLNEYMLTQDKISEIKTRLAVDNVSDYYYRFNFLNTGNDGTVPSTDLNYEYSNIVFYDYTPSPSLPDEVSIISFVKNENIFLFRFLDTNNSFKWKILYLEDNLF